MSTESLITNLEYNTKMDKNISILSDTESILPEDLSYDININTSNEQVTVSNNKSNKFWVVLKINVLIGVCVVSLLGILYL
jgi:hypothetical protein